MKIVDARAISVWAVDPRNARNKPLYGSWSHKYEYFVMNPYLNDKEC